MTEKDCRILSEQVRAAEGRGESSPELKTLMKTCAHLERVGVITKTKANAWGVRSCKENVSQGLPGGYWFTKREYAAGFARVYAPSWEPTFFGSLMFFKKGATLREPVTGC